MAIQALSGAETFIRTMERASSVRGRAEAASVALPSSYGGEPAGTAGAAARVVGLRDGRDLVTKAVEAAQSVLAGLAEIRSKAETARDTGYLAGVPDISRVTLGADVRILIGRLDDAVAKATAGGASLVSGSGTVRIATTGLGGSVTAAVQALDSRSLGIDNLDLSTDDDVTLAIGRITSALVDAGLKAGQLEQLSRTFGTQDSFLDNLRAAISSRTVQAGGSRSYGSYDSLGHEGAASSRGVAVNILA